MSDSQEKQVTDGQMDRQANGLTNMNSQGLPTNTMVRKIFKKNKKIDKSIKK